MFLWTSSYISWQTLWNPFSTISILICPVTFLVSSHLGWSSLAGPCSTSPLNGSHHLFFFPQFSSIYFCHKPCTGHAWAKAQVIVVLGFVGLSLYSQWLCHVLYSPSSVIGASMILYKILHKAILYKAISIVRGLWKG